MPVVSITVFMEYFYAILNECEENGLIPTLCRLGDLYISHLLFANDVIVFANASIPVVTLRNYKLILESMLA